MASLQRMDKSSTAWRLMLERAKLPEYARSSSAYIHGFLGLGERVIRLYAALKCATHSFRRPLSTATSSLAPLTLPSVRLLRIASISALCTYLCYGGPYTASSASGAGCARYPAAFTRLPCMN